LSIGGEEQACGWLRYKFGFRWQVVPSSIRSLIIGDGDQERTQGFMNAMLGMKKMDLAELERAYSVSE